MSPLYLAELKEKLRALELQCAAAERVAAQVAETDRYGNHFKAAWTYCHELAVAVGELREVVNRLDEEAGHVVPF
jgi:hypothetical protein